MTVVQNTELTPDSHPIPNVLVEVKTSVPAATASATGTVVGEQTIRSNASGFWSFDLIPNQLGLQPKGTWYVVTRKYPRPYGGGTDVVALVVPSSPGPVSFESCVVSTPEAQPLTDSELVLHLAQTDPHPQYLTQTEGDARYAATGSTGSGGGVPSGAAGGDLSGNYPNPTVKPTVVTSHRLDELATPQGDVPFGGHKLTAVGAGASTTDALNVSQMNAHKADGADPHAASAYTIMVGGGRRAWVQDSTPTGSQVADGDLWVGNGNVAARRSGAWVVMGTGGATAPVTSPTPVTPTPPISTDRAAEIKNAVNEFFAEYVRSDGAVLQKQSDNKIVSEGHGYAMLMAVLVNDQAKYDLVHGWANTHLKRSLNTSLTTGKNLWAWSYSVANSTVNDWNWASDAEYDRAIALLRACQLWGRQSDYDALNALVADLKTYTLNYDEGRAYQTSDAFQQQVGSGQTLGHHQNGSGGYVWEMNISYLNPMAYRMLKAYTGDVVWDQAVNGYYDILTKTTDNAGSLSTTAGLPPDWCDYSTNNHSPDALTSGTNGWTYTRSTNYGYDAFRTAHHAYQDWIIYNEQRAKTWLAGTFATFMRNEWTTNSTFGDGYTHTGTKVSSNPKLIFAYAAYEAIYTANNADGVASAIKSNWLTTVATTNSFGTYLRNDAPGVTPTSTYYGNAWMIFCESMDAGLYNTIAAIPGQTGKYNAGASTPTTPTTPGTPGGTTTPTGSSTPPAPTGGVALAIDANSQLQGYTAGLSAGTKKTRFQWVAAVPQTIWTGPEWDASGAQVQTASNAAKSKSQWMSVSVYGIVNRDLSGASAGGSAGASQYNSWIQAVATAIGTANCIVTYEPDSIPQMVQAVQGGTKTQADLDARITLMQQGIQKIKSTCPNVRIYVDAGHGAWFPDPTPLIPALQGCGLANCSGIAANVSNFRPDSEVLSWAKTVLAKLGQGANFGFIWDTSRNGANPPPPGWDWGNPLTPSGKGVQFGRLPQFGGTVIAGEPLAHGCLWVKHPGESDGPFNGGPAAGTFWPDYLYTDGAGDNSSTAAMLQRPPTPGVASPSTAAPAPVTTGGGTTSSWPVPAGWSVTATELFDHGLGDWIVYDFPSTSPGGDASFARWRASQVAIASPGGIPELQLTGQVSGSEYHMGGAIWALPAASQRGCRLEYTIRFDASTGPLAGVGMLWVTDENTYGPWPTYGELDISEWGGGGRSGTETNIHYNPTPDSGNHDEYQSATTINFATGFHDIAFEWGVTPGQEYNATFIDGVKFADSRNSTGLTFAWNGTPTPIPSNRCVPMRPIFQQDVPGGTSLSSMETTPRVMHIRRCRVLVPA